MGLLGESHKFVRLLCVEESLQPTGIVMELAAWT